MRWEATGAHRTTGQDSSLIVEADTEDSAVRRAGRAGLMVESIRPLDPNDSVAAGIVTDPPPVFSPTPPVASYAVPRYAPLPITTPARTPNILGIIGVVFASIALTVCWIPIAGFFGLPLAILGGVLGLAGLITALAGNRWGYGSAIAAIALAVVDVAVQFIVTGALITAAGNAVAQQRVLQASQRPSMRPPSVAPAPSIWNPAAPPFQLGTAKIRIASVRVGQVQVRTIGGDVEATPLEHFIVNIEVTNSSPKSSLHYSTWRGDGVSGGATATTDTGRVLKLSRFGMTDQIVGAATSTIDIPPSTLIRDILVFESPPPGCTSLTLSLPGKNVGAQERLSVQIPVRSVRPSTRAEK